MKFILSIMLLTLSFQSKAQRVESGLTKTQIIKISAEYITSSGQGRDVEGCEDIDSDIQLVLCLINNTYPDPDLENYSNTEILYGTYELNYNHRSGNCGLTVEVNASKGKVTYDSGWDCM